MAPVVETLRAHVEQWWGPCDVLLGRPWLAGSACDYLYLSTAYLLPREFAVLGHAQGGTHLLWAVPVTEAEKAWRHEHGQEAFEQLMEDRGLIPFDPSREPLELP